MTTLHAIDERRSDATGSDHSLASTVRQYWDDHVLDWAVTKAEPGSAEYFQQIERYRFSKLEYLDRVIPFDSTRDMSVLDVGCGLATDSTRFARSGAQVYGIDLSEVAIEYARKNFELRGLEGTFRQMNGERMSYPDDSFDAVYCHTVLHFTPDPSAMVQEIWRVLKPGGLAMLMTVNRRSWMNIMRKVMKVEIDHLDSPVFQHMTYGEFRRLLEGFSQIELLAERFPTRTEVHRGLKAKLFNRLFVDTFNLLPRAGVSRLGHHLLAFCRK